MLCVIRRWWISTVRTVAQALGQELVIELRDSGFKKKQRRLWPALDMTLSEVSGVLQPDRTFQDSPWVDTFFSPIRLRAGRSDNDGREALQAGAPMVLINPSTSLKVRIFRVYGQPPLSMPCPAFVASSRASCSEND